jgi:restriction endonuclease Mrr
LKRLERAQTKANEAGALIGSGSEKKGKKRLGSALRKLKQAAALLESKRGKKAYEDAVRTALGATVAALQTDLETLRGS